MAVAPQAKPKGKLVDLDNGMISREIFVSDAVYQEELDKIFSRSWFFIGHESQVPKPGDYFVSCMGEESVILCRDRLGDIHVFLNSCRHRGMKVCRYDEGNTPVFTCPYHGWSYATDGKLVGVPYFKDAYLERLDKSEWGLVEVAQLENYKGSIWATWDRSAPGFDEYIGGFKIYLDLLLDTWDGQEGGTEVFGGVEKWEIPCNWKFPAENFVGDRYHNISHRSVDLVGIGPSGQGRRDTTERNGSRSLDIRFPDKGHGTLAFLRAQDADIAPSYQESPVIGEYFRWCEEQRKRRRGEYSRLLGDPGTVFPNMSYLPRQPRSIAVWHPRGAGKIEAWRWYLVDKDAPQEVKEFLRHYYLRYSGPGGLTEQDDMENWNYAHAASSGVIARRNPYNYEMGLGLGAWGFKDGDVELPGLVLDTTGARAGEQNQRALYARWSALMEPEPALAGRTSRNGKGR